LKIEAIYNKNEILETYLNTVPFLYNAYGIEMAARTYFDTSADQLDVLQSATLVGMLKGNTYYNPVLNPERALQRRNTVLKQMVKRGKLTSRQFDSLKLPDSLTRSARGHCVSTSSDRWNHRDPHHISPGTCANG